MNKNTYCPLPWMSLELDAMGTAKPCCLAEEPIQQKDSAKVYLINEILTGKPGAPMLVSEFTLNEIQHSEYMSQLRSNLLAGVQDKTCQKCWAAEAAGHHSKRQYALLKFGEQTDITLRFVDLKLGNICNIKCRICGDVSSSQWASEMVLNNPDRERYITVSSAGRWPRETPRFWQEIETYIGNIEELEITGGEPLLIQEQFAVLKRAIELDVAKNITVHYNTNGTVFPEDAITNIWPHFKQVELAFSIDNVGDRFEYERYPANWNAVKENVNRINRLRLSERWLQTQICCTVSKFNIYYLPEITEFITTVRPKTWYYNLLHSQEMFNISYFALPVKLAIKSRLEEKMSHLPFYTEKVVPIINFMMADNEPNDQQFLERVAEVDSCRGQALSATHPELYALLNEKT